MDSRSSRFNWSISVTAALLALTACGGGGDEPSTAITATPSLQSQLGSRESLLSWTPEQQRLGYRNMEMIYDTRSISRSAASPVAAYPLPETLLDLSAVRYQVQGITYSIADYIANNNVAGLLVIRNGAIVYERYSFGHTRDSKWTSFSVAKSVVSLLFGAAIHDGFIASIDTPVTAYLPTLAGTSYDGVTIRHLLRMTSGVQWNESYTDPQSDVARIGAVMRQSGTAGLLQYMGNLSRVAAPGARFNYSTGETHLAGAVLSAAVGENLSAYLSRKIWSAFAMESDAFWMLAGGAELGGCCLSATLRDYGRIGLYALGQGVVANNTPTLPPGWMANSTTGVAPYPGYGYLWWLGSDYHAAIGIFGQSIQIYPQQNLLIVMHSFWPAAGDVALSAHRAAVSAAIRTAVTP